MARAVKKTADRIQARFSRIFGAMDPAIAQTDKVKETADDAAMSKASAVRHGYYADPYVLEVVKKPVRRSPLINRGYFARVAAVDLIIRRFVELARRSGDARCQVVNLGAGACGCPRRSGARKGGARPLM